MVWLPAGEFSMGVADDGDSRREGNPDEPQGDARPVHRVRLSGFWMDRTEVTNEQFARFVAATGYLTAAERAPTATLESQPHGWGHVQGASWRHPSGPGSDLAGRERYPVVHVAWDDAVAFARWAHKRLPTEAEFEYAARGGLEGKRYAWGDELRAGPGAAGASGIAAVGSRPANGFGLYDVAGNVWEWTGDWYRADYYAKLASGDVPVNPRGPDESLDPEEPGVPKRVQRGGAILCASQYCSAYLVGARGKGAPSGGAEQLGFRCARDP
jgi:formylglycine-generating enzyme required for sulfatase activity